MNRSSRRYDAIGVGYRTQRRADPRIAKKILAAVGNATHVVNIGAGTGNYEPEGGSVVAVEPSGEMIRQRAPRAAPVVRGLAEALPFPTHTFECAMAVLTVHHWADFKLGLQEMRRVAPRQVIFAFDVPRQHELWITSEYLPEAAELEEHRAPRVDQILECLGGGTVEEVPIPHDCIDGFFGAYWRRPHSFLEPTVRRSISSVAQIARRSGSTCCIPTGD